jgi:hypothetical protein
MSAIKSAVDAFVGFLPSSSADDQYQNVEAESDERPIMTFSFNPGVYIHLRDEKLAVKSDKGKFIYFTLFPKLNQEQDSTMLN